VGGDAAGDCAQVGQGGSGAAGAVR